MPNLVALLVAALVPMIVGFAWYHPKVFGTAWMKVADMTEEKMQGTNMLVIFGVSYVLSFLAAGALYYFVVHQAHVFSILLDEPGFGDPKSEIGMYYADFMERFGDNYRTFGHGVIHGVIAGISLALPVLGTNALFERKGFKYIAINGGYWIVTFAVMGGIICAWK
ncbi:MAG: DUF1761 domain-containing protein [Lewinellaceae bacterium]|nr:DUF1761 domain-containing protein [Phaeodactylibacter sp.]MCB9037734.1 DUF1761 domain-containing protein [Lewinellaceae bacterium]